MATNQPLGSVSVDRFTMANLTAKAALATGIYLDADPTNSSMLLQTNGTNAMYVDKFQNVGINNTSPAAFLDINKGTDARPHIQMTYNNTANTGQIAVSSDGKLSFTASGGGISTDAGSYFDVASHDGATTGLKLGGVLLTATATELNNLAAGSSANDFTVADTLTITNANGVDKGLILGSTLVTSSAAELNYLDGSTPGTVVASTALVVDSNKDLSSLRMLTVDDMITITNANGVDKGLTLGSTLITATGTELNYLDGSTPGTSVASKALVADSSNNIAGLNSLSSLGLTVAASSYTYMSTMNKGTSGRVSQERGTFTISSVNNIAIAIAPYQNASNTVDICPSPYTGVTSSPNIGGSYYACAIVWNIALAKFVLYYHTGDGSGSPQTLYYKTSTDGSTWSAQASTGLSSTRAGITVRYHSASSTYVAFDQNKFYYSSDGTTTWSNITLTSTNTIGGNNCGDAIQLLGNYVTHKFNDGSSLFNVMYWNGSAWSQAGTMSSANFPRGRAYSVEEDRLYMTYNDITTATGTLTVKYIDNFSTTPFSSWVASTTTVGLTNVKTIDTRYSVKYYPGYGIICTGFKSLSADATNGPSSIRVIRIQNKVVTADFMDGPTESPGTIYGNYVNSQASDIDTTTQRLVILGLNPAPQGTNTTVHSVYFTRSAVTNDIVVGDVSISQSEIGFLDGAVAGTAVASKALIVDSSKNISSIGNIGAANITSTTGSLTMGATTITESEIGVIDGVVAGTASASKALVVDGSKNISSIGNIGAANITSTTGSLTMGATTITEAEIGVLDGVTAGTASASKALIVNSNKDISSIRNISSSGTITIARDLEGFVHSTASGTIRYATVLDPGGWAGFGTTTDHNMNFFRNNVYIANFTATGVRFYGSGAPTAAVDVVGTFKASGVSSITDVTDSTSSLTGALVVSGGVGIAKNITCGGAATFNNNIRPLLMYKSDLASGSNISCVLGKANTTDQQGEITFTYSASASNSTLSFGHFGTPQMLSLYSSGVLKHLTTTDSTVSTDGAFVVAGGVGIAKKLNVAGITKVSNSTATTTTTDGAFIVTGGVGIGGGLNVGGNAVIGGNLTVSGTTTTVNSTTLTIADNAIVLNTAPSGMGIDSGMVMKRYQVANDAGTGDIVNETPTATFTIESAISTTQFGLPASASSVDNYYTGWWIKITSGTNTNNVRKITGYVGSTRIVTLASAMTTTGANNSDGVSLYSNTCSAFAWNSTTGTFIAGITPSDGSPSITYTSYAGIKGGVLTAAATTDASSTSTGSLIVAGGAGIAKSLYVGSSTDSSSTSTGALVVTGGVGIGAKLTVGGVATIAATTTSTSSTTGALVVSGGVGIAENLYVGGTFGMASTTDSSSTTTGAFVVAGGVGIAKKLYVGGITTIQDTTDTTGASDGALVVAGGVDIAKSLYVSGSTDSSSTSTGALIVVGGVGIGAKLTVGGATTIADTTTSTSSATGALVVGGGLGVAENLYVGGTFGMTSTTDSSSTTTGAFVVAGGVGIAKKLYVGGITTIEDTTDATSSTDGALVVAGGAGIAKSLYIGGATDSSSTSTGALVVSGGVGIGAKLTIGGATAITDTTGSTSTTTGALVIGGGLGVAENLYVGGTFSMSSTTDSSSTTTGAFVVGGGVGIAKNLYVGGIITVEDTTDSTSSTDGALVVAGGVGIAKSLYVGSATDSSSTSTGALVITGGVGIGAKLTVGGATAVTDATDSSSASTGALVITGGVGIGAKLTVGGVATVADTTDSSSTSTGALVVTGGVGIGAKLTVGGATAVTDATDSSSASTGALVVTGGVGVGAKLTIGGVATIADTTDATSSTDGSLVVAGGVGVAKSLYVGSATGSTSTTSGALVVAGGVGVAENLYIGGITSIADLTDSTTTSTGALVVAGGVGIAKNLTVGGAFSISDTTESSSTSTGAFVVAGGVGIAKKLYVGGITTITDITDSSSTSTGSLVVGGGLGVAARIYVGGVATFSDTTDSSSTSTGSVVVGGGLGVAAKLFVGGATSITDTTDSSSTSTGALVVAGGAGIAKNLTVGGIESITDTTDASSTSTGALVVAGGLGVAKKVYIGSTVSSTGVADGALVVAGGVDIGQNLFVNATTDATGTTDGALVVAGGVGIAKKLFVGSATDSSSSSTGALVITGGVGVGAKLTVGGVATMADTTDSTTTATGALVVAGGVGVAKNLTVGGVESITDTTDSTTTGTGALVVAGGVGITKNITIGGTGSITDTTESSSTSTGALVVAGGVGIAKKLNVAGITTLSGTTGSTSSTTGTLVVGGGVGVAENLYIGGTTDASSSTTGTLVVSGGVGVAKKAYIGDATDATASTDGALVVAGGVGVGKKLFVGSTTGSTSSSTGALVIAGGAGVAENLYIGGTTDASSTSTGSLVVSGGVGITKKLYVGSTAGATSASSGALVVSGGAGIAENLYIGGNATIAGNLLVSGTTTTINTTTLDVADNTITVNAGPSGSGKDGGMLIQRYQVDNDAGTGDVVADTAKYTTTIDSSADSTHITFVSGANINNDYYKDWWVKITSGSASDNVRKITAYDGATLTATLSSALSASVVATDGVSLYNKTFPSIIWQEASDKFVATFAPIDSTTTLNTQDYADFAIGKLSIDGTQITATATELNYVDVTPGVATLSKALVLDANKDVATIHKIGADALRIGTPASDALPVEIGYVAYQYTGAFAYNNAYNAHGLVEAGDAASANYSMRTDGRILCTGEIEITSDRRLKENIIELTPEFSKKFIMTTTPVKFNWRTGDKIVDYGYIAQDIYKKGFTDLVTITPSQGMTECIDDDGFISPKDAKFVFSPGKIIPMLALNQREVFTQLEAKDAKIEALESRIAQLEALVQKILHG